MKDKTIHIKKPSNTLLNLVRKLRKNNQSKIYDYKSKVIKYFPKN